MDSSESSVTIASSATLFFGAPPSPGADNSGTLLRGPPAAGIDSTPPTVERKQRTIWLAPTPMSYMSDLRYSRRDKLNYNKVAVIETVPPANGIKFRPDTVGALGWKAYEHPEGSVYFRAVNFYTNVWLYDPVAIEAIEEVVERIRATLASFTELSGRDIEFGLDLIDDEEPGAAPGDKLGCYYAVDKTNREVFWLHEVGANFYCDGAEMKIISREHLRKADSPGTWSSIDTILSDLAIRIRDHCYMFPHGRSLSSDTVSDLRAMLSYNMLDKATSRTSVAPYNEDDAHRLFQIFRDIEATESSDEYARPEHVVMIVREKLLRFHGERYAQLDSNKSVFEEDPKNNRRSVLFEAFSWLFFFQPHVYFEQLSRTWVDNKVNYDTWRTFVGGLQDDWAVCIIPASIVLAANVGFLAVQSIEQGSFAATDQTIGQIASYVSTLLNIGCVAASLMLAGQHHLSDHRSAEAAVKYLCGRALSKGGVERLAIIFSVPATFFRWGLVSFATAIFWLCLHDTSVATRITICIVAGISTLLLVVIAFNGEWNSWFSTGPLASGMKRVRRLVRWASTMVATRPRLFIKPKRSMLPE
ncbi:hypothetical protein GSI_14762 [Ganoderma sinense ZZ0214-1]|uniref:Uncharacterized protein n=1 Tax=Ganoderma sinense ZZ0214-1 TaxID=1077348 RepID=A0A2G8RPN2_9APHY|nr:hypothetical protein GSI_14762 [Ganoderma sinense ZZ0214-1]